MSRLKILCAVISMIIGVGPSWSVERMNFADKENDPINSVPPQNTDTLMKNLVSIAGEIQEAHRKVYKGESVTRLHQASKAFQKLDYPQTDWQTIARQWNVYKWPGQDGKRTVGGHLFYPDNVNDLLSSRYTIGLLERIDMIWAFAIAARHQHPLGQYYLGWTLDRVRARYTKADRPEFLTSTLRDSLNTLYQCQDHPDACYVLGVNRTDCSYQGQGVIFDISEKKSIKIYEKGIAGREKGLRFYEKGGTLQNRFAALKKRFYSSNDPMIQRPTADEYLVLAQEGYAPAYVEAFELMENNFNLEMYYLEEAVKLNFPQAFISMGLLYEGRKDFENAIKYYEEAGKKGVGKGYIKMSEMLSGGDLGLEKYAQNIPQISEENIQKIIHYLTLAGKADEPEGWNQLAYLYGNLYKVHHDKKYVKLLASVVEKGVRMRSDQAYAQVRDHFSKSMEDVVQTYGRPPQADLYKDIESFLNRPY